jgi:hypothetical protein
MRKIFVVLMLIAVASAPVWATVGIDVGNGVVIETTSGVTVEIDGDLTETGTGYFKGVITSGARTGMTSFAGMTLSSGMDGTITRCTGTAYAKSNGEGLNLKRYYEVNNTGGSAVVADMSCVICCTGANDEQNTLGGPYFIYKYVSSWEGCGDGCGTTPVSASSVSIPTGASDWVLSEGIRIAVKIYLEGSYDVAGDTMRTTLAPENSNYIPTLSPHTEDARTVSSVPNGVVDWVLVEVRSTADGTTLGYRSCFIDKDGELVNDDNTLKFTGLAIEPGSFFLVIRHRNHLAIETPAAETGLSWGVTPTQYDFTTALAKFYGSDAKLIDTSPGNVYGMYAGEGNDSGIISIADGNVALNNRDDVGYEISDYNMSGIVTISDVNLADSNRDATTQVVDP